MALLFASAGTDRVDIGAGSTLQGLTSGTILAWVYPLALASRFIFAGKYAAGGASVIQFSMADSSGNLKLVVAGTTSHTFTASSLGITANAWNYVACTFVFGTSGHIYAGSLTSVAAEPTYSASTNGSAQSAETGGTFLWSDRYTSSAVAAAGSWNGRIALGQVYNRALSLAEVVSLQFNPRVLSGCVSYHQFGHNGTSTQPDWSGNGNNGTVTGATQTQHVPLGVGATTAFRGSTLFRSGWASHSQLSAGGIYVS